MGESSENIVPITENARSAAYEFSVAYDRELFTILFTDLVDSTRLQADLGNVEAARLTELHRRIVRDELAKYNAREIEWAGDSCLAVFTKPSSSVLFALWVQMKHQEMREREPRLPTVRVGIHLGEIVVHQRDKKEDLFGLQVSETARVMSVARGGQIFCTRTVFDSVGASLKGETDKKLGDIIWARHGHYLLKGTQDPIEICEITTDVLGATRAPDTNDKCQPVPATSDPASRWKWIAAAIAATLVILSLTVLFFRDRPEPAEIPQGVLESGARLVSAELQGVRRYPISLPTHQPLDRPIPIDTPLALSPDGKTLAYRAMVGSDNVSRLVLRQLHKIEGTVLPNFVGVNRPFFSPDGRWVGFIGIRQREGKSLGGQGIFKVPIEGGEAIRLADIDVGFPSAWTDDGHILFTPGFGSGLFRVSDNGGQPELLLELEEGEMGHTFPSMLPNGRGVLYTSFTSPNVNSARLMLWDARTDDRRELVERAGDGQYINTGHIVYAQEGALAARPFDLESLTFTGPAFDVTELRMTEPESAPTRRAISATGTLAYVPTDLNPGDELSLVWVFRDGRESPLGLPAGRYSHIDIAPNGEWASVTVHTSNSSDIWRLDIHRNTFRRLTFDPSGSQYGVITPDSSAIVFGSVRDGTPAFYQMSSDGSGDVQALGGSGPKSRQIVHVLPDGSAALFRTWQDNNADIFYLPLDGSGESRPLLNSRYSEFWASVSPNGKWLTYTSDESGRYEVYVVSYPDLQHKVQVSNDSGHEGLWSADGAELFYYDDENDIMRVEVQFDPTFQAGPVELLLEEDYGVYDIHPDGDRFLAVKGFHRSQLVGGSEIIVVENWFEEINQRQRSPARAF